MHSCATESNCILVCCAGTCRSRFGLPGGAQPCTKEGHALEARQDLCWEALFPTSRNTTVDAIIKYPNPLSNVIGCYFNPFQETVDGIWEADEF